jgi:hypothetical protein
MPMMKQNTVFATLAVLSCLGAADVSAQSYFTDRGAVLIGGEASLTSSGSVSDGDVGEESERTTGLVLAPSVQFFVIPGLALGGESFISYSSGGAGSVTVFSLGPAISYFFGGPDSSYYPFVSAFAGISNVQIGDTNSLRTIDYNASAGLAFPVARNVALTGALFYKGSRQRADDPDIRYSYNTFGLRFGFLASIF